MLSGTIRYFDAESGHGFIEPHAGPIVAHIFVRKPDDAPEIHPGMDVSYRLSNGRGRILAVQIEPL